MAKHGLVTLLTDFGTQDPYVAAMKGAVLRHLPAARIVDITHEIAPHDILQTSFVLAQAAPQFPAGTIHVVVVDPGVGTGREIIAAEFGDQVYLFPDNGVITMVAQSQPLRSMALVRNIKYIPHETEISRTFHGRDIFAPLAGHLARGVHIADLGPTPMSYKLVEMDTPVQNDKGVAGQVVYVDRFGNLVTNITQRLISQRWPDMTGIKVACGRRTAGILQSTYGQVGKGKTLALINSMGLVEVAANAARASDVLEASVGAKIRLTRKAPPA